jgi:hypothetical protein
MELNPRRQPFQVVARRYLLILRDIALKITLILSSFIGAKPYKSESAEICLESTVPSGCLRTPNAQRAALRLGKQDDALARR